jgi:hypothetical protein
MRIATLLADLETYRKTGRKTSIVEEFLASGSPAIGAIEMMSETDPDYIFKLGKYQMEHRIDSWRLKRTYCKSGSVCMGCLFLLIWLLGIHSNLLLIATIGSVICLISLIGMMFTDIQIYRWKKELIELKRRFSIDN